MEERRGGGGTVAIVSPPSRCTRTGHEAARGPRASESRVWHEPPRLRRKPSIDRRAVDVHVATNRVVQRPICRRVSWPHGAQRWAVAACGADVVALRGGVGLAAQVEPDPDRDLAAPGQRRPGTGSPAWWRSRTASRSASDLASGENGANSIRRETWHPEARDAATGHSARPRWRRGLRES